MANGIIVIDMSTFEYPNINGVSTENIREYFGPIMAACRKRAGLSQEQLAEMLFCSRTVITKLENNNTVPKMDLLPAWAEATNSKEALVAFIYGEQGIRWIINKLKLEGHWPEDRNEDGA